MERIVTHSTVGGDGTLVVRLGPAMAGRDVQVTVEPAPAVKQAADMTQEEWRAFVLATAGSWEGDFDRGPQGERQERDRRK